MVEQPAFASGCTALFDLAPDPFVVIDGAREQVQGDLIHHASGLLGQPGQLGREFWWNLEIHEAVRLARACALSGQRSARSGHQKAVSDKR